MRIPFLILLPLCSSLAACSADAPSPSAEVADLEITDHELADDAVGEQEAAPADLGQPCAFGCTLATCVDLDPSLCEEACFFDRAELPPRRSYCTARCDDARPCPSGWSCVAPEDGVVVGACRADPAVCGDDVVQLGEACDDGGTEDGDRCAGDCSRVTLPSTTGRVTLRLDGGEPFTFEGAVEGGFATLDSRGTLAWSETNPLEVFGFALDRFAERTSADKQQSVSAFVHPLPCNFHGQGSFTPSAWDPVAKRVAGTFEVELGCTSGCFDCGGDGARRTLSVDFDLQWLDRPDL